MGQTGDVGAGHHQHVGEARAVEIGTHRVPQKALVPGGDGHCQPRRVPAESPGQAVSQRPSRPDGPHRRCGMLRPCRGQGRFLAGPQQKHTLGGKVGGLVTPDVGGLFQIGDKGDDVARLQRRPVVRAVDHRVRRVPAAVQTDGDGAPAHGGLSGIGGHRAGEGEGLPREGIRRGAEHGCPAPEPSGGKDGPQREGETPAENGRQPDGR